MINQLNSFNAANLFVVFINALLYTQHICLFLDLSKFQKYPLTKFNYGNAGILSAVIATVAFFSLKVSSKPHKIMWVAVIGFVSATALTLCLQRVSDSIFQSSKAAA